MVAEAVGLGVAVDYLSDLGMERVRAHERELTAYMLERLATVPGLRVVGPSAVMSTSYPSRRKARDKGSEMEASSSASSTRVIAK